MPGRWSSSNEESSKESEKEGKSSKKKVPKARGKSTRKTKQKKTDNDDDEEDDADADHQALAPGKDDDDDDDPSLEGMEDLLRLNEVDVRKRPASRKGQESTKRRPAAASKTKPSKKKEDWLLHVFLDLFSFFLSWITTLNCYMLLLKLVYLVGVGNDFE